MFNWFEELIGRMFGIERIKEKYKKRLGYSLCIKVLVDNLSISRICYYFPKTQSNLEEEVRKKASIIIKLFLGRNNEIFQEGYLDQKGLRKLKNLEVMWLEYDLEKLKKINNFIKLFLEYCDYFIKEFTPAFMDCLESAGIKSDKRIVEIAEESFLDNLAIIEQGKVPAYKKENLKEELRKLLNILEIIIKNFQEIKPILEETILYINKKIIDKNNEEEAKNIGLIFNCIKFSEESLKQCEREIPDMQKQLENI
jgi:hypothetical protein